MREFVLFQNSSAPSDIEAHQTLPALQNVPSLPTTTRPKYIVTRREIPKPEILSRK
jgi:hypothetical protein